MREILFRGFHECENGTQIAVVNGKEYRGEWVFGYFWTNEAGNCFIKVIRDLNGNFVGNPTTNDYEVIPETVGQFIGLTDKNGKKIFEGDYAILKDSKGQMRLKCVYVDALCGYFWERSIYLNKHGLWLDSLDKIESHRNIEIIGNIHDKEE